MGEEGADVAPVPSGIPGHHLAGRKPGLSPFPMLSGHGDLRYTFYLPRPKPYYPRYCTLHQWWVI